MFKTSRFDGSSQGDESPARDEEARERRRIARLHALDLLDTGPEPVLDRFTTLAASITAEPIALISLIDRHRQWFKAAVGLGQGDQTSREDSFCTHAVAGDADLLVVEDALLDERFCNKPAVLGAPHIRFYAGAPLIMPGGERIGTLCVAGPTPRRLLDRERGLLVELARAVVHTLLLRESERDVSRKFIERSELLDSVIEHLPQGLLVLDGDRRHVVSNRRMQHLLDIPSELLLPGTPFESMVRYAAATGEYGSGSTEATVGEVIGRALSVPDGATREHTRPDGTILQMQASRNTQSGWQILTYSDVTAERRAALLADERLRQAMQAAQQASLAKSSFVATMSHEIRTPINGVIGLAQMLAQAELPPREKDYVAMIESCAKSLLALVNDVLDLSKIEAGQMRLAAVRSDVHALVGELATLYEATAREQGLSFRLSIAPDVPRFATLDENRLRQVLLNLLGNALKFTPSGSVSLVLSGAASVQPGLRFEVIDTGIGIAAHEQSRLFSRFHQIDSSASRKYRGSGLGLAIAQELAQLMGGRLSVRSEPDVGSSFALEVPYAVCESEPAPVAAPPVALAVQPSARVLLVEDDPVNQIVSMAMLEKIGIRDVVVAENGCEALERAALGGFDLVLMDCQMPVLDGLEATRRLRAAGFEAPIVALTAGAGLRDRETCMEAGMNDYLAKPVILDEFAAIVGHWLAIAARTRASQA
ncbi:ATP-binding protein [Ramlibacter sp. AN1015]|uniref:hybrid sensor histidine kinase/response regulator n=1 Tax=Ramlibacter sp. AN1015 TaxID=3133428 RepID=UPI0030BC2118